MKIRFKPHLATLLFAYMTRLQYTDFSLPSQRYSMRTPASSRIADLLADKTMIHTATAGNLMAT